MNKNIILIAFSFFIALNLLAQKFEYYSYEQALVNDNVRSLEEDIFGNIWIGTTGGITKFDGHNFISFTTSNGLGGNIIYDIHAHSSGNIYAATSGGLSVFNGSSWTNYTAGNGLPSTNVWCVTEDLNGDIWIGTSDVGIAHFNGTYWQSYSTSNGLISNTIKVIYADRNGNIWCGAGNGVSKFDGTNFKNFNTLNGLPGPIVNDIIQLSNGNIAIATNNGISIYNFFNFNNITTAQGLPGANVLCIRQDYNQNLLIGTSSGLSKYNWATFQTYTVNDGISNNIVNKIAISHSGDNKIWIASPFNGVTVFDNNNNFIIYRTNRNIAHNNVTTVLLDNNITWIGTENGLNKVNGLNWRTFRTGEGLTNNYITAIHKDVNNNLWVGTANGLNRINGLNITQITTAQGLTNSTINNITSDPSGKVYVATANKITIIENGIVIDTLSTDDGLNNNNVKIVHFQDGVLWVMTQNAIQYYNGSSFINATNLGCLSPITAAGAKSVNSQNFVALGDDNALRIYNLGFSIYQCFVHPYQNIETITAISEKPEGLFCTFANGDIQVLSSSTYTWGNFNSLYPGINPTINASFLAGNNNDDYLWIATSNMGIVKACLTCNSNITVTASSPTCHNNINGNITITSPAGTNFSINNGNNWQASPSFNSLSGGYYHLLVKNAANHVIADSIYYLNHYSGTAETANLTINQILCYGDNDASILLAYDTPGSHLWENNNTSLFLRQNLNPGVYSVTVTDGNSCQRTLTNTIFQPSELTVIANASNISCNGANNGQIQLNISGGTGTKSIQWNTGQNTATISNLSPGTYSYTVTDENNCVKTGSILISEPPVLLVNSIITNNDCYGNFNGSIDITISGGTSPYTITWTPNNYVNSNNDIVNAPAGNYHLHITDANNCVFSNTYTITQPNGIIITNPNVSNVLCYGQATGEIEYNVSGGFGTLSFQWQKVGQSGLFATTQNLYNLTAGTYNLTITDENNCSTTQSFTVNQSPELNVNISVTPISCAGYEDGQLFAQASGGSGIYSAYYWHNSQNQIIGVNQHITGLGAGNYYVVVRDSYYCYDTAYASLTQSTPHVYQITTNNVSCYGNNNGSIIITIDGGSGAGFTFNWQNGVAGNTNVANNLTAGHYSVTITDPTNCTEILPATINQPPMQDIGAFNNQEIICYGNSIILNPGNFSSYQWSTGQNSPTLTVYSEGLYYVRVIDANGCQLGDSVYVMVSTVYQNENINLATVTNDNKVKLLWNKTPNEGTQYYKIYKQTGSNFTSIANISFNNPAIYLDDDVDPSNYNYSYKISAVDSCGAESDLSPVHKTIRLEAVSDNNSVCYLNWSPYEGFFVVYYYIMRGSDPNNLQVIDSVLYNQYNFIQMNPNPNGTYYRIKVRRIDGCYPGDGNYYYEAYSNTAFCQNPTGNVHNTINNQQIYPNPFKDEINIEFSSYYQGDFVYTIFDLSGKKMIEPTVVNTILGQNSIKIKTELAPGIYILNMKMGEEIYNYRIMKLPY